jgi:hypothetical protein
MSGSQDSGHKCHCISKDSEDLPLDVSRCAAAKEAGTNGREDWGPIWVTSPAARFRFWTGS